MHELKRTRRKKLHVGPDRVHNPEIALRIGVIADPLVGESLRGVAMRAAGGHLEGLPLIEFRRGANVGVNVDNHGIILS
jgi:hypothetical protein